MRALIFDMDGLLIDSERLYFECQREIARQYGKEPREEIFWKMMGRKPLEALTVFRDELDLPTTPQQLLRRRDELMLEKMNNDLSLLPGIPEILASCRGRLRLAVATGAPEKFLNLVLDRFELRSCFDVLVSSDEIDRGKPDPEIYLLTTRKLGLAPEECLVLEDSANGALAAKKARCYVIAVPSIYTKNQDFSFVDFVAFGMEAARLHILSLL